MRAKFIPWLLAIAVSASFVAVGHASTALAAAAADCGSPAATPVRVPIVVSLPPAPAFTVGAIDPASFRHPPVSDPSWRLHYQGFMYLLPLVVRAAADRNTAALSAMTRQLVAFHRADPDPNSSAYGWDEGTAQRRLQVENCLYAATHDRRLVAGIVADVRVQLGWRYYGPPLHPVHNHGVMANLRIIAAGALLGNADWITVGMTRLRNESVLAFSAQGMCWEQSAQYQLLNVDLWKAAAHVLATDPRTAAAAATLVAITNKAAIAAAWLTEPDGHLVQIGDSERVAGRSGATTGQVFRDDAAGYLIGRWSWTDPTTTYYTVRYGPARRAHGQPDRGGLTWSTDGTRVLVDPGLYGYDNSAYSAWRLTPSAHNVAAPDGGAYRENARAWIASGTASGSVHRWLLDDTLYGQLHTRAVVVDDAAHRLVVTDRYASATTVLQHWHLDPIWQLVTNTAGMLVFTNGAHLLTISTTGRITTVSVGATSPVAGWNFPHAGIKVPAYEITVSSALPALTTTFLLV